MSEQRPELPRTLSTAIPAIPLPSESDGPSTASEDAARAQIAALEREAKALGPVPAAALLFYEVGTLWEGPLRHPRNAAVAYQQAFRLAPGFLANIRAARRLFAQVGNWAMVVTLIDAELAATTQPSARANLLFEKGEVLEKRLSREPDAAQAFQQCLELKPTDLSLLIRLEQTYSEKADERSLATVSLLLADAVTEPSTQAAYLTQAGMLLENRLGQPDAAAAVYRRAFVLERRDPELLCAVKRLAQRSRLPLEELEVLAAEAETQGAAAAPTFLRMARIYEQLGRNEDALSALVAARKASPHDVLVFAELARIYESQSRLDELAEVLEAWAERCTDENEFVAITQRLAALREQTGKSPEAIRCYRAILNRSPRNGEALASIGKLYFREQNWAGLVETYDAEAITLEDTRQKAGRVYKAAETLEERLGRTDEAIARYRSCLQLVPGYLPAQKALIRLYESQGRWSELVLLHEQDLLQTQDLEQQIATLHKMAALFEDRLHDLPQAIDCLRRVLELAPDHVSTMRNLARLYERNGQWAELLELHEAEIRHAGDTKHIISLTHRSAEILDEQLHDKAAAIATWERVVQLAPTYLPALRALGRLYEQEARWAALIKMHRAEAELAPAVEQAASLAFKVGELFELRLKDEDQAISAYREVLTLSPAHTPALRALTRIYRAHGDWAAVIELLRSEAASRNDPLERANTIVQAAAIWEEELKKPDAAIEAYREAVRLYPSHPTALAQLERLFTLRDDIKELVILLDRQTQSGPESLRIAAGLKLARLYFDRLNEPSRAANCCETVLGLDKGNLGALRLLERIRAHDKARRHELRERVAQSTADARLVAALRISNFNGSFVPQSLAQLKSAAAADSQDAALQGTLEQALLKAEDTRGLIDLYQQRLTEVDDAQEKNALRLRIAALYERRPLDVLSTLQAYEQLLQHAPGLYPALLGQLRCYQQLHDSPHARATLEAIAASVRDPVLKTRALLDAAALARDAENNDELAKTLLQQILAVEPLHSEANAALDSILERQGNIEAAAAANEARAEAHLGQKNQEAAARDFLKAARLRLSRLQQRDRASQLLDRVLLAQPNNTEALEIKGAIALEGGNYAEATAALAARVQLGGDAKVLARLNLHLGALYQDHLSDLTRAAAHLQTALASDPSLSEALDRLAQIHLANRNWVGAADALRRLIELTQPSETRGKHALTLARITDERFGDLAQALTLYRQALELLPHDAFVLDRLVTLYERTGALSELVEMLERQAMQTSADRQRFVTLQLRLASLYTRSLNEPQRAIEALKQVINVEPQHLVAWAALAELYSKDSNLAPLAIDAHRALVRLEPGRVESLRALTQLWRAQQQVDRAFCAAAQLVFLRHANTSETLFYNDTKSRLPQELKGPLRAEDILTLHPEGARHPAVEVLRAIGDQFEKLLPPQYETWGIDRRADRLKPDHAVSKALAAVCNLLGLNDYLVFQSKRGLIAVETTEPLAACIGQDVSLKMSLREQRFFYGRVAMGLFNKTAIVRKVSPADLSDIIGNSIRIHQPTFDGLGLSKPEQSKQLRRAFSRRALRTLEGPAQTFRSRMRIQLEPIVQALAFAGDRLGLLAAGDIAIGLEAMLRSEGTKPETAEAIAQSAQSRVDLKDLLTFSLSDEFFKLRQKVGVALT